MFEILPVDSPSVSTSLLVGLVALCVYQLVVWYRRYTRWLAVYDKLPSDRDNHWFFGHMHKHPGPGEDGIQFMFSYTRPFPRLHALWFGRLRCILIVHHPDTVKIILRASAHIAKKPRGPGTAYMLGIKWLGEGLLISNGDKWARNRRLLTPAFHFDMLKSYLSKQNACTDVLMSKMEGFATSGQSFEVFRHLGLCSLDIISRCAFSRETNCQTEGENNPYVQAVGRLTDLWIKRSINVLQAFDFIYFNFTRDGRDFTRQCDLVHDVSEAMIKKRIKTMKQRTDGQTSEGLDFLDIILQARDEDGRGLTFNEVRDEVDTFLFEGHDTTTSALSFILYALAKYPEIQEKCRQEINSIFQDRDNDVIQYQDLSKMEYLTQCIKEGLRLFCPVFFIQRQMTEDVTLEGYHIPEGTHVALAIYNLHHNATVWGEDNDEYKPERFEPETARQMDPYAFLPFSAGQRNCIGQIFAMNELKIVLSRLINRYTFTVKEGQTIRKKLAVVMRTENGIWLDVKKRVKE
ncbi:cytochrome P450 4F12-like [Dreissena polymorpha]|uniref:Cytochrome P450 n=1 Tax=Dreissena polymorpha TaxID=45954 RepID=A0A9D4GT98_DREPO|nr:cytochrome P450 4F12-like [Dreissena polymorpha]KAH3822563.1 hypothetical protein DPMN_124347 [Dreissena polymorpha]